MMLQNPLTNALLLSLYWKNRTAWIRKMSSWQSKITSSMLLPLRRKRVSNFLLLYISAWLHPFFFLKKSVAFRCINHWPQLEKENLLVCPGKEHVELTCSTRHAFARSLAQPGFQSFLCNHGTGRSRPAHGDIDLWSCSNGYSLS